jgi:hypothetical protein
MGATRVFSCYSSWAAGFFKPKFHVTAREEFAVKQGIIAFEKQRPFLPVLLKED